MIREASDIMSQASMMLAKRGSNSSGARLTKADHVTIQ